MLSLKHTHSNAIPNRTCAQYNLE